MDNDPLGSAMSFLLVPTMYDLVFIIGTCAVERQNWCQERLFL